MVLSRDLVLKNILGSIEARSYEELIKNVLVAFENLVCSAYIKMHYLFSNLNWFSDNLRSMSDGIRR